MKTLEQALTLLIQAPKRPVKQQLELNEALHYILAQPIYAPYDVPPFDKAAMDGYACRMSDLPGSLILKESIPAGKHSNIRLKTGECARIMTGAPVPDGADCVVEQEIVKTLNSNYIQINTRPKKNNIVRQGEDLQAGSLVFDVGQKISPATLGMLAMLNQSTIETYAMPRVVVFATGSELRETGVEPEQATIVNSNSPQILALLRQMGLSPAYGGILPDNMQELDQALTTHRNADLLIFTGGVSVGDFDLMPALLNHAGLSILFDSVAIKPGKPVVAATDGQGRFVLALSGNPVSSFFQFVLLVRPLIYSIINTENPNISLRLPLANDYRRKSAERTELVPVTINEEGKVVEIEFHGSAHLHALARAQALMIVPQGIDKLPQDTLADVRLL